MRSSVSSSNEELAQRHADLSTQLAEVSEPGLREAKIILERVGRVSVEEDEESSSATTATTEHVVIKRVHEFTEHVRDLKTKLSNDTQERLVKNNETTMAAAASDSSSVSSSHTHQQQQHDQQKQQQQLLSEVIEFESKYSAVSAWVSNVGEAFLAYHRDMGTEVAYVSDYVDNHQQMSADLREHLIELDRLRERASCLNASNVMSKEQREQIAASMERLEVKWRKLCRSVEERIVVANKHLEFIKLHAQSRNAALDLQELFRTECMSGSGGAGAGKSLLEQRVFDKMASFDALHKDLVQKGRLVIEMLRKVSFTSTE
jgi:hypothetical protein